MAAAGKTDPFIHRHQFADFLQDYATFRTGLFTGQTHAELTENLPVLPCFANTLYRLAQAADPVVKGGNTAGLFHRSCARQNDISQGDQLGSEDILNHEALDLFKRLAPAVAHRKGD